MAHRPSSASRAGRRGSQASTAPSSPALDCTGRNYSGGAIARDERGLLPIPGPPGRGRILSNTSSPSKASSQLCSPFPRGGRHTPATSKTKLSRTVSAILPTPQNGPSPFPIGGRSHLLNGRLPFKVVQGNGPGNTVEVAQHGNPQLSKKLADVRNGVIKKISNTSKLASGLNKKDHPDGHQGSKVFQDGSRTKEHEEEVDGTKNLKERRQERSHSGKELVEKSRPGEIPVVTILQRPKNKEAAAELISKFFHKATGQEILTLKDDRVEGTSDDLLDFENSDGVVVKSETEGGLSEELSDYESSSEVGTGQNISFPSIEHMFLGVPGPAVDEAVQAPPMEGVMDGNHLRLAATAMSECVEGQRDMEPLGSPEETEKDMVDGCDEFALWERWAGPSYINSPPPSALPIPRFPRKQSKIQSSSITEQYDEVTSGQMRARFITPSPTCMSGWQQPGIAWDVVATATKDLKRILNLDLRSV